jgi:hypothetical protein
MQTSTFLLHELNRKVSKVRKEVFFLPFHKSHISYFDLEAEVQISQTLLDSEAAIEHQAKIGPAFTVYLKHQPLIIFGLIPFWSGVAELWSVIDDRARRYPKSLTIGSKTFCDIAMISMGLHRLQITIKTDLVRNFQWATRIGFKKESVLKNFGPDKTDFFMMTKIHAPK